MQGGRSPSLILSINLLLHSGYNHAVCFRYSEAKSSEARMEQPAPDKMKVAELRAALQVTSPSHISLPGLQMVDLADWGTFMNFGVK